MPIGLNAEPRADAAFPGVKGADGSPQVSLGCPSALGAGVPDCALPELAAEPLLPAAIAELAMQAARALAPRLFMMCFMGCSCVMCRSFRHATYRTVRAWTINPALVKRMNSGFAPASRPWKAIRAPAISRHHFGIVAPGFIARLPPSIGISAPVIQLDASEARSTAKPLMSSGSARDCGPQASYPPPPRPRRSTWRGPCRWRRQKPGQRVR